MRDDRIREERKPAISFMEIFFIIFVLFFIYSFVVKQMLADVKFSDMKQYAATTYNTLDSAAKKISMEGGFTNRFYSEEDIIDAFAKEVEAKKVCKDAMREFCWSNYWLWDVTKTKPGFEMKDGQFVTSELTSYSCTSNLNIPHTCGALFIDVNGEKAPNIVGQDMIKIYITAEGLVPAGVEKDIFNPKKNCDLINKFNWGCTARLLGLN